jgi:NADPH:quinone reductase
VSSFEVIADAKPSDEALVRGRGADHVVARGDDVAQRIRAVAPNGVDGLVDCAALHDLIVAAVRDGGSIATPRWYSGPNDRGTSWHPVVVSDHTTRHDVLGVPLCLSRGPRGLIVGLVVVAMFVGDHGSPELVG